MELFRKASFARLLVGLLLVLAIGCGRTSKDGFETYDQLKKSAGERAEGPSDREPVGGNRSGANHTSPAVAKPEIAKTAEQATDGRATKSPAPPSTLAQVAPNDPQAKPPTVRSNAIPAGAITTDSGRGPAYHASIPPTPAGAVPAPRPGSGSAVTAAGGGSKRKTQLLVPARDFKSEGREGALRVTYDDLDLLKVLNMEPVTPEAPSQMPGWLKSLDGRRIRIRGFMYPTFQQTGVHAFGLARDNQICCFGRDPKIYDVFDVVLRTGVTTDYIPNRPFDVVGVFHIRPEADEGKLYKLYEMDDATVVPK